MTNNIVVLGAGVSGLTAALLLSKSKGNSITVISKHMPGDYDIEYTSPWAGANMLPMAPEFDSRWERRTWPELNRLAAEVPEAGIHFQKSRVFRRKKDIEAGGNPYDALYAVDPWYRNVLPDYRELNKDELPPNAYSGSEFTSVCINTALYLPYLVGQCRKNGVVFKRGDIAHVNELTALHHSGQPADIIVNSSGLLACKLGGVEDKKVVPARGQVVVVRNEVEPMATISGTDDGPTEVCYMMTRAAGGGTILGGTYDKGNWDANPDPNIAIRIMKRCVELCPSLTGGKGIEALSIIRHGVGLRPYREGGLRLEIDKTTLADGTPIVHHYGHAGWGYQGSYGTAEGVVELVNQIRAGKGENLAAEPKLFSWDRPSKFKLKLTNQSRLTMGASSTTVWPAPKMAKAAPCNLDPAATSATSTCRSRQLSEAPPCIANLSRPAQFSPRRLTMAEPAPPIPIYVQASRFVLDVANGRHALSKAVPPVLLALDAVLCGLIIWKIPYTEIDWVAYMEQISQYVSGERDYTKIKGGTGPLVYPAAHVYTYTGLYYLTEEGKNIFLAQQLFAILYLATLAVVMACYWQAKVPPYIFPLLILSKRLHSVFVLRCFNDCFATLFLWLAIFFFQKRLWTPGAVLYSWGLGIKMSLLLVLPAVGIVLFLGRGFGGSLRAAWLMAQVQIVIGIPFVSNNAKGYLGRAFELSRQFFFKWTVNWRFVGEETFLSKPFSIALLGLHATALLVFVFTRWLNPTQRPLSSLLPAMLQGKSPFSALEEAQVASRVTPRYILTTILSANVMGLLFARSLHYQFYAYLAWSTPYLLWRSGLPFYVVYILWAAQEWAWNVYPSTDLSSEFVVGVMAVTVAATWFGTADEGAPAEKPESMKR